MRKTLRTIAISALLGVSFASPDVVSAAVIRDIRFPVDGAVRFQDDFGDPRSGGRTHEGIDIMGTKMMPLVAAVDGYVSSVVYPEESWGYAVTIRDDDGWSYHYLHVNNDTPGTDDGNGGFDNAYAPGLRRGQRVTRGQFIAYMGDSGNAESVGAHLHFEIRNDRDPINPYESLLAAERPGAYDPELALLRSRSINDDKGLYSPLDGIVYCLPDTLIKTPGSSAVYYCGRDGKRYVFPHKSVYDSWYEDFSTVQTITDAELAHIPIGGNVTYRPGSVMVKIQSDPKVYAIDEKGTLRWVTTAEIAAALYGANWGKRVVDVSDTLFINYSVGEPITTVE
jgi:hypothetical protein